MEKFFRKGRERKVRRGKEGEKHPSDLEEISFPRGKKGSAGVGKMGKVSNRSERRRASQRT